MSTTRGVRAHSDGLPCTGFQPGLITELAPIKLVHDLAHRGALVKVPV